MQLTRLRLITHLNDMDVSKSVNAGCKRPYLKFFKLSYKTKKKLFYFKQKPAEASGRLQMYSDCILLLEILMRMRSKCNNVDVWIHMMWHVVLEGQ